MPRNEFVPQTRSRIQSRGLDPRLEGLTGGPHCPAGVRPPPAPPRPAPRQGHTTPRAAAHPPHGTPKWQLREGGRRGSPLPPSATATVAPAEARRRVSAQAPRPKPLTPPPPPGVLWPPLRLRGRRGGWGGGRGEEGTVVGRRQNNS